MHRESLWEDTQPVQLKAEDDAIPFSFVQTSPADNAITRDQCADHSEQNLASWPVETPTAFPGGSERVADSLDMPLLVLDKDLRVQFANRSFCESFSVNPDEAVGRPLVDVGRGQWSTPDLFAALVQSIQAHTRGDELERLCATITSGPRAMRLTTRMLAGPDDSDWSVVLILEDITGLQAVDRLRHDFVNLIIYEMNTALTQMVGQAKSMLRHSEYNAQALTGIVDQARLLGRLTQDIRDTPSFDPDSLRVDRRWIDLAGLVRSTTHLAQIASPLHNLRLKCPRGGLEGLWDADRLTQILSNLLSNAIKYSPAGGEIVVSLDDLGAHVRISIRDQGCGIEPKALRHLFDQSYRVPASAGQMRGLGLGLFITRVLVEAHGGDITVESLPDQGSTFHVVLPRALPLHALPHRQRSSVAISG